MEVTRLLSNFRTEKEAIMDKSQKERHKSDDLLRDQQLKFEKQMDNQRNKLTF